MEIRFKINFINLVHLCKQFKSCHIIFGTQRHNFLCASTLALDAFFAQSIRCIVHSSHDYHHFAFWHLIKSPSICMFSFNNAQWCGKSVLQRYSSTTHAWIYYSVIGISLAAPLSALYMSFLNFGLSYPRLAIQNIDILRYETVSNRES